MLQAQYDHGRAHGELFHFGTDGQVLAKETYEEGRKLAPKVEYHDARQLVKKSEALYLHAALVIKSPDNWDKLTLAVFEARGQDEKHGPFLAWHENGQTARQGEFRYDLPVGKFQYWYANGQKQMDGSYVDGRPDGPWIWWHENGLKSIAGAYTDGAPSGLWQWWKATGKLAYKNELGNDKPLVGPTPEAEGEEREAKVRLADPVIEVR
jgi:antitoxin component YwqK of YwqJK toxin-antitoxin module